MQSKKRRRQTVLLSKLSSISPNALRLLNTTLPFLLCAFIWFGVSYILASFESPVYAEHVYRPAFDNLMVSLCLLFGGAAILDRSIARGDFDK
jgi:hypothetical protein